MADFIKLLWITVVTLLTATPAWSAEYSYIDSREQMRYLQQADDWIACRLSPNAEAVEIVRAMSEISIDDEAILQPGKFIALPLTESGKRAPSRIRERMMEENLCTHMGLAFKAPNRDRPATLDRGVLVNFGNSGIGSHELANMFGLEDGQRLGKQGGLWLFQAADSETALDVSKRIARSGDVAWALPDFRFPIDLCHVPNDPYYPYQWYHRQDNGAHISSEAAWDISQGSSDVVVAVIDTGVDSTHPDFDPDRIVAGYDVEDGEPDPSPNAHAVDAHGTCAAGLVAASIDNDEGIAGVCPSCSLMGVRFLDGLTNETQLSSGYQAIAWAADHGAWVLSNSWEIGFDYIDIIDMEPFYMAISEAAQNGRNGLGAVVVVAAGNSHAAIDERAMANHPEVIAVGATDHTDALAAYSNHGPNVALVAPGGSNQYLADGPNHHPQIFTTDVSGSGGVSRHGKLYKTTTLLGDVETDYTEPDATGDYTRFFTGTSAATPIVAGVAALILSINPDLKAEAVRRILTETSDKMAGMEGGVERDDYYGHGRVNAARAVQVARFGVDGLPGAACSEDVNCAEAECLKDETRAMSSHCMLECLEDSDCPSGAVCRQHVDKGYCAFPCENHDDCSGDMVCMDSYCLGVECNLDSECPTSSRCNMRGICTADGNPVDGDAETGPDGDTDYEFDGSEEDTADGDDRMDGDVDLDDSGEDLETDESADDDFPTETPGSDEAYPDTNGDVEESGSGGGCNSTGERSRLWLWIVLVALSWRRRRTRVTLF